MFSVKSKGGDGGTRTVVCRDVIAVFGNDRREFSYGGPYAHTFINHTANRMKRILGTYVNSIFYTEILKVDITNIDIA